MRLVVVCLAKDVQVSADTANVSVTHPTECALGAIANVAGAGGAHGGFTPVGGAWLVREPLMQIHRYQFISHQSRYLLAIPKFFHCLSSPGHARQ
jgi:hypothetical protein